MNVDPVVNDISDPQRLNRYSYCLNDPINYIDPDGADPIILAPGSLGGAIVIAFLPQVPDAAAAFIIQSILKNLPSASSLGVGQQTAYYNIPSPGSNVWIGLTAFGAAKRAADRIDKDCSNFFSAANASGAGLRSMLDKGKILYKDLGVPQGTPKSYTYTVAQQDSGSIFINSQGPFDNPTATKLGSGDIQNILADFNRSHQTDLTETQFQELFLIHEYAHTFGTTLLENDRKADGTIDIDASQRNTQKVLDNCFKK